MNRREFLKTASAVGAVSMIDPFASARAGKEPKQVILILGESTRADMLNCYRNTGLRTPNLDRLASQGARMEKAYNCQPVCAPARSAIFTGVYPHSNGVWANSMPMAATEHTLPQYLSDQGIHCAYVGKWHLDGFDYFGTGRAAPGWDPKVWYDMRNYLEELTPEERVQSRKESPDWPKEKCFGYRCTNKAVDFITQHRGEDYFLVLAYDEPHGPSLCPKEYREQYEGFQFPRSPNANDPLTNKPAEQRIWASANVNKHAQAAGDTNFFASHAFVDAEIGRVLDAIEQSAPNAMVLYTADHGVSLGSHGYRDKGPAMYEEITRIPFLVKWPGVTPANAVCPHVFSHIDVAATLMDYFGLEVPKTMHGTSMLSTFKDPAVSPHEEVFLEWGRYEVDHDGFGGYQPIRCVRDGRYKLSIHLMTTDELYDLEADPGEMNNLIDSAEHAQKRNELHDKLLNWMNVTRDPFRGYYWGRRAWRPDFPEKWGNAGMTRQRESDGYLPRELDYETGLTMGPATRPK